jgi:hypothetical protein
MTAPDNAPSASGSPSPVTLKRSRWLYWGGIVVFVVATALISGWVLSHDTVAQMKTLQDQLAATQPWLLIWRLGLMSVLIGCYPVWVNRVADFLQFHPLQRQYALSQRWPVAIAILLVELLFAQRGLAVLLHWLFPDL